MNWRPTGLVYSPVGRLANKKLTPKEREDTDRELRRIAKARAIILKVNGSYREQLEIEATWAEQAEMPGGRYVEDNGV